MLRRARLLRVPPFGRADVLGALAVFMLALAAFAPGPREVLLALSVTASVAWLAADALREDRSGPRARLGMAVGLALLAALPAVLFAADHRLWNGSPIPRLDAGLALWSVGILALACGARLARVMPLPARFAGGDRGRVSPSPGFRTARPRGIAALTAVAVLVAVSLVAFVESVGGPVSYLHNLNNSAATTHGLTYLIWGMLFAKYGSYAGIGEAWAARRRPSIPVLGAAGFAIVMLLFVGSRLLLLVALIQLLLLYAALGSHGRRFGLGVAATALVGAIAFIGIGEFRRWENVAHRPSFQSYLVHTGLPQLPRTYVNQYADAVRLSVLARQVVPRQAGYEYGKELLRVLLHPIPSSIRPKVGAAPALSSTFTSENKNGNALPIPVEGYIEFGFPGVIAFSLILGLFVGLVDRIGAAARDVGVLGAAVAAGTGAIIVFRGSLAEGIALAAIDVIGFFVAHRVLFSRGRAERTGEPAAGRPRVRAVEDRPAPTDAIA